MLRVMKMHIAKASQSGYGAIPGKSMCIVSLKVLLITLLAKLSMYRDKALAVLEVPIMNIKGLRSQHGKNFLLGAPFETRFTLNLPKIYLSHRPENIFVLKTVNF